MITMSEAGIIAYMKKRRGWVDNNDLSLHFKPTEKEILRLHALIESLVAQGKLLKTSAGYKISK